MSEHPATPRINRHTDTAVPLHPLLAGRYSPRAYDPAARIAAPTVTALLEAARWAPSASNRQPRRFIVAAPEDAGFAGLLGVLNPGNQVWAARAALLVAGLALTHDDEGTPLRFADYDLGQAVAHLTFQATAAGLHLRQMGGFDAKALAERFRLPARLLPRVVLAIGHEAAPETLPADLLAREAAPRSRLSLQQLQQTGPQSAD